ncbi:hypothetical protein QTN25_006856 [Entamoeba marina]
MQSNDLQTTFDQMMKSLEYDRKALEGYKQNILFEIDRFKKLETAYTALNQSLQKEIDEMNAKTHKIYSKEKRLNDQIIKESKKIKDLNGKITKQKRVNSNYQSQINTYSKQKINNTNSPPHNTMFLNMPVVPVTNFDDNPPLDIPITDVLPLDEGVEPKDQAINNNAEYLGFDHESPPPKPKYGGNRNISPVFDSVDDELEEINGYGDLAGEDNLLEDDGVHTENNPTHLFFKQPDLIQHGIIQPDIIEFDVIQPDVIQPDVIQPDVIQTDVIQTDVIQPDVIQTVDMNNINFNDTLEFKSNSNSIFEA